MTLQNLYPNTGRVSLKRTRDAAGEVVTMPMMNYSVNMKMTFADASLPIRSYATTLSLRLRQCFLFLNCSISSCTVGHKKLCAIPTTAAIRAFVTTNRAKAAKFAVPVEDDVVLAQ